MTDLALGLGGRRAPSVAAALRRGPPLSALAVVAGLAMVLASAFMPWAVRADSGRTANAFEANLPWLVGGTDLAQQSPGSFANGWILIAVVVIAAAIGYPLLAGRRMVALPLGTIGAISSLYIYFTAYRFDNQFSKIENLAVDMGSGWWLALVGSLLVVAGGVLARLGAHSYGGSAVVGGAVTIEALSGSRDRRDRESAVRTVMLVAALASILVSALIILALVRDAFTFMLNIDWASTWTTGWFPRRGFYDVKTLIVSTGLVVGVSTLIATPVGLGAAVYLSEYAKPVTRRWLKPTLEILAGIPSVVFGFFALQWISPNIIRNIDIWFGQDARLGNLAAAGVGVGFLSVPLMASISEDAMKAVPNSLREASAGLGSRKVTTTLRIVLPAAVSGLVAAFIVTTSRAVGETMVVFIAGGGGDTAVYTHNVFDGSLTMTAAMASLASGTDSVVGEGLTFESLYFVGLMLFLLTLGMNLIADRVVRRFQNKY
ncbi:MAG: phosphate ABC transporter permease subunit PstC [Acidimicrobiia bacterium]|nr:phosphate ABC transporter permease subunit PstC [Acidimicrobiia bacterium]